MCKGAPARTFLVWSAHSRRRELKEHAHEAANAVRPRGAGRGARYAPGGRRHLHAAKNVGRGYGAELATYIVEEGKPLVVLAK
jgi:hypothetical protein